MAKNFKQEGEVVVLTAPYARTSGQGALVGALFGVALVDVAISVDAAFAIEGVFELAKTSAQAWAQGAKIYWDDTNKVCTTTATSNTFIGNAMAAAVNPSSVGLVRLNGAPA